MINPSGEQPSFDYAGDTERPGDLAIDEDYADKLDAAQSIEEVGRFEHEIEGDLELKVSNFKQKGDEAMDLGILCFDVEFNKKLSMTQPPNLVMHQPDGSHIRQPEPERNGGLTLQAAVEDPYRDPRQ